LASVVLEMVGDDPKFVMASRDFEAVHGRGDP